VIKVVVALSIPALGGLPAETVLESIQDLLNASPQRKSEVLTTELELAHHGVYVEGPYGAIRGENDEEVMRVRKIINLVLAGARLKACVGERGHDLLDQLIAAAYAAVR
jgi:hypothetical protein